MLSKEIRNILKLHQNTSPQEVALKLFGKDLPVSFIIQQIEGRQKVKEKLPSWFENEDIIYPARLSVEQCSSEITAQYKTELVSGKSLADLTGGFGVDTSLFSAKFDSITYFERNTELFEIAKENFKTFNLLNINAILGDGISHLSGMNKRFDVLFIDPARRDIAGKKVFQLLDCEPNVVENLEMLFSISNQILIKTSPILDIEKTILDLKFVKEVHVVSVNNECKEVLYLLEKDWNAIELTKAINFINGEKKSFEFDRLEEKQVEIDFNGLLDFVYEPNASILKAGAFKSVAKAFGVKKIAPNTHLYTSEDLVPDFQGRCYKLIFSGKEAEIKKRLIDNRANIVTRNYPLTADELRKKIKVNDGGLHYIIGFKDSFGKSLTALFERLY